MIKIIPVKIKIPAGPTVVWKKNRFGELKATKVQRKAYIKTIHTKIS